MSGIIKDKYIKPFTNFGFKKLFGTEFNKPLLINFLNQLIGDEAGTIKTLIFLKDEHLGRSKYDRNAKNFNFDLKMIETAGHIDNMMPHRMSIKIASALNRHKKAINGSKVLFMGVAYKPNIDDARESPALSVIDEVAGKGGEILYHDPYIKQCLSPNGRMLTNSELTDELLESADVVVFTTNHDCFDPDYIVSKSKMVVDLRNMVKDSSDKVYKL